MARPKDPNKKVFDSVGLRPADWDYVRLWSPSTDYNPSQALEELVDAVRKFRPGGPNAIGREFRAPRERVPAWVSKYAADQSLTRYEAIARLLKAVERPDGY